MAAKIKAWNNADFKLYDHFNKTFWRRVEAFGRERMDQELESFRAEQKKAEEECIESYQVSHPFFMSQRRPPTPSVLDKNLVI